MIHCGGIVQQPPTKPLIVGRLFMALLCLSSVQLFCQRQQLQGKVIADQVKPTGISIHNTSLGVTSAASNDGDFVILAGPSDVLRVFGEGYTDVEIMLTEKDFKEAFIVVRVEPDAILLNEVVVPGLTGNLATDSRKAPILDTSTWFDPAVINKDVIVQNGIGGINFIALAGMLFKKKPVKEASGRPLFLPPSDKVFSTVVREKYPQAFFTNTLNIPVAEIPLFLHFCDDGANRHLLAPANEFRLIQYLQQKSVQYLKKRKDEE